MWTALTVQLFCAGQLSFVGVARAQEAAPPLTERVVVWLDRTHPEESARAKAEREIGGDADHVSTTDLAWPPQEWSKADTEQLGRLSKVQRQSQERWEEFDVELGLARELASVIDPVTVLRDVADRDALVNALLWEAASVNLAFSAEQLKNAPEAAPFRVDLGGVVVNGPLLDALALDPERVYTRGELPEAGTFLALQELRKTLAAMPGATLAVGALPDGTALLIDGRTATVLDGQVSLTPGHHYLHLIVGGVMRGRAEIDARPGATIELPYLVSDRERDDAERLVEERQTAGLPADVETSIARIGAHYPGAELFLAGVTGDGRVIVVPYSGGARLIDRQPVTFVLGAELGGALVSSPYFYYARPEDYTKGDFINTPAVSAAFQAELGFYNFAVTGEAELYITPLNELVYGSGEEGATSADNYYTVVSTKLTGGVGAYLLRPKKERRPTLLVAANYGWFSPGHVGPGARLTFGLPMDKRNWFKFSLHGWYGMPIAGYPEDEPLFAGGFRVGFQSAL